MNDGCAFCSSGTSPLGARKGYSYHRCRNCGAVQIIPRPDETELDRLYSEEYSRAGHYPEDAGSQARNRRAVVRRTIDLVEESLGGSGGGVLEVGCGWGCLLEALRSRGIRSSGLEPSLEMADHCRRNGLDVTHGRISDLGRGRGGYAVIVSMAVFEHLVDPVASLELMSQRLDDGGSIIIQCPTAGYARMAGRLHSLLAGGAAGGLPSVFGLLEPPWHVNLPTPAAMRNAAARSGLALQSVLPSPSGRDPGLFSLLQMVNDVVGAAGFRIAGEKWPLLMAHFFVLRRTAPEAPRPDPTLRTST